MGLKFKSLEYNTTKSSHSFKVISENKTKMERLVERSFQELFKIKVYKN
jgi:hypothetical protein